MKVILKSFVHNLGKMGQTVDVADGYGRNFLFPRGLAVPATTRNVSQLQHELRKLSALAAKQTAEARGIGEKLAGFSCTISKAVGETGRLYGSVTSMEIEDELHEAGFKDITRKQIQLDQPLKEVGEFEVPIRIHPEVTVQIKVHVIAREGE
jgi:large subunit ribosomal protein L9